MSIYVFACCGLNSKISSTNATPISTVTPPMMAPPAPDGGTAEQTGEIGGSHDG